MSSPTDVGPHVAPTHQPPTTAAFSPTPPSASRATLQAHQKSPLLVATPPQVTRALSKAFPWIQQADRVLALLTWTTDDPCESFLVVAGFWAVALYGDALLRWAGNLCVLAALAAALALRRHCAARHDRGITLDEILATLTRLNHRVDTLLAPAAVLLHDLSPPSPSVSPSPVATVCLRILLLSPLWIACSVWPLHVLTTRRIVVVTGTLLLSWHSRPAKVSRTILWRSTTLRTLAQYATGLPLAGPSTPSTGPAARPAAAAAAAATAAAAAGAAAAAAATATATATKGITPTTSASSSPGVKFTFAIYENQRRWLGVGWTATLFTNERASWTDEHLSPCPPPAEFELPETARGAAVRWRWVPGEDWRVEGATASPGGLADGWWYYDGLWRDGRKGVDSWAKYTRRRKWVRRAELVEVDAPPPAPEPQPEPEPEPEVHSTASSSSSSSSSSSPSVLGLREREQGGRESGVALVAPSLPPLPPRSRRGSLLEEDACDSDCESGGSDDGRGEGKVAGVGAAGTGTAGTGTTGVGGAETSSKPRPPALPPR